MPHAQGSKGISAPRSFLITAGLACVLLAAVGIGDHAAPKRKGSEPAPPAPELRWPPPPQAARIRYLDTFTTPQDLGMKKSFFRRLGEFFRGDKGETEGIRQPYGVAVDREGRIYLADSALRVVHIFDVPKKRYRALRGTKRTEFDFPVGVALDAEGRLYVSDAGRPAILGFNASEKPFLEITEDLGRPTGIAFNPTNALLYVTDTWRHEIRAYDLEGHLKLAFGGRGEELGRFNFPTNITVDSRGYLYVTDTMNFRVQVLEPDGKVVRSFGRHGDAVGDFASPKGIGVDSEGHVYVVEGLYDTINVFDPEGRLLLTFGSPGAGRGEFWLATGLFVDGADRIYVADSYNGRIQIFQYIQEAR